MKLYLVQHAEAYSKEESPQRTLNDRGKSNAKKIAAFALACPDVNPLKIFQSGKTRAEQTAEILGDRLRPEGGTAPVDGLEPMADAEIWVKKLKTADSNIMLVGHLPHLAKLSAHLLCEDESTPIINFKNSGIVCLERNDVGNWSLDWIVTPEIFSE